MLHHLLLASALSYALCMSQVNAETTLGNFGPQEPPFIPKTPIAIVGGTLIDGTGKAAMTGQAVLIVGNIIKTVGPRETVNIPEGAQIIDATDMTVMPGLIDASGDVNKDPLYMEPATGLTIEEMKARWKAVVEASPHRAYVSLMQGVTTIRHAGGKLQYVIPLKEKIDAGEIAGPRLFLGGAHLISQQHFAHIITQEKISPELVEYLRKELSYYVLYDLDATLDKVLEKDYTYIKIVLSSEQFNGSNDFTDAQIRKIIAKTRARGKKVDFRATNTNRGYARLLKFDFDTLEYPFSVDFLIDKEIVAGFAKKGIIAASQYIKQTTAANHAADPHLFSETTYVMSMMPERYRILMNYRDRLVFSRRNPSRFSVPIYVPNVATSGAFDLLGPSYEQHIQSRENSRENMHRFIRAGVKLAMGTDGTTFLNFQQDDPQAAEMQAMVESGLSPIETIVSSTRHGAEVLGMRDYLGTLEEGKLADVIVVAGDPLTSMDAMRRVAVVVKNGVRFK